MGNNKLKFGIIGTGWITEAYVDGALDSGLWELTAIYSRNMESGLTFGKKYNVDNVFTDIEEMANSNIDAVYIASPNYLHFRQATTFLNAGKHVICEKPVSAHSEEVKALQELAKEKGLIFLEAIMYMHLPAKKALEEAISEIGNVSMVKLDFCQRSSKLDSYLSGELPNIFNPNMETGALMDLGIYCIYPALALFGVPESYDIHVTMMPTGVDGSGIVNFYYKDKIITMPYSKVGHAGANSDIQGTYGTVYIESISRLANIVTNFSNGTKKDIYPDEAKYKLMGYEAKNFYKFITEPETTKAEYDNCTELCYTVSDIMEKLRKKAGITFPSDK